MFIYFININYLGELTTITGYNNNVLLTFSNVGGDANFTYTLGWILGFRSYEYNLITIEPDSTKKKKRIRIRSSVNKILAVLIGSGFFPLEDWIRVKSNRI
mgnify:CR=1 FL=1